MTAKISRARLKAIIRVSQIAFLLLRETKKTSLILED